jgi:tetratricopeptide (TPR) repeat protein
MRRLSLGLVFLVLAFATTARADVANDSQVCRNWSRNFDASIAACTRLIESGQASETGLPIFFSSRGEGWSGKGDLDRAIADFTEAARLDRNPEYALRSRACLFDRKREHARADEAYRQIYAERNSLEVPCPYLPDKPMGEYDQAIKLRPSDALARYQRDDAYARKCEFPRAIEDYSEARRLDPDSFIHFRKAEATLHFGCRTLTISYPKRRLLKRIDIEDTLSPPRNRFDFGLVIDGAPVIIVPAYQPIDRVVEVPNLSREMICALRRAKVLTFVTNSTFGPAAQPTARLRVPMADFPQFAEEFDKNLGESACGK